MNWGERKTKYNEWYFTEHSGHVKDGIPIYSMQTAKDFALKLKSLTGSASFLDCGCAVGMIVHGFSLLGLESRGIDISQFAIEHSFPEIRTLLQVCDISEGLPFENNSFDTVISFDLLEHLHDYASITKAIKEMCRCAKKSIFLRQPMTTWFGEADDKIYKDWLMSQNPLPHKTRLALIDHYPLWKSSQPTPTDWEHPNENSRNFWITLFEYFGMREQQLPEEEYIFPNILGLISANTLYFVKDN
jgi:ubiquinone/menaquinone biosynthesis C-methylase UbiE